MTCAEDEPVIEVIRRNQDTKYDFLPVTGKTVDDEGQIVGMLEMASLTEHEIALAKVGECMKLLSERYLVGADTSVIEFIRHADERPCRLTVAGESVSGLACLYDMQKLPARAALFALITHLEISMADVITEICLDSSEWLNRLTMDRREKIAHEIARAKNEGAFVNPLLYTQFGDKATILRKEPWIKHKNRFRQEMQAIQRLRDSLAHANDYASTRDACRAVCRSVRSLDFWATSLADWQEGAKARCALGSQHGNGSFAFSRES